MPACSVYKIGRLVKALLLLSNLAADFLEVLFFPAVDSNGRFY